MFTFPKKKTHFSTSCDQTNTHIYLCISKYIIFLYRKYLPKASLSKAFRDFKSLKQGAPSMFSSSQNTSGAGGKPGMESS